MYVGVGIFTGELIENGLQLLLLYVPQLEETLLKYPWLFPFLVGQYSAYRSHGAAGHGSVSSSGEGGEGGLAAGRNPVEEFIIHRNSLMSADSSTIRMSSAYPNRTSLLSATDGQNVHRSELQRKEMKLAPAHSAADSSSVASAPMESKANGSVASSTGVAAPEWQRTSLGSQRSGGTLGGWRLRGSSRTATSQQSAATAAISEDDVRRTLREQRAARRALLQSAVADVDMHGIGVDVGVRRRVWEQRLKRARRTNETSASSTATGADVTMDGSVNETHETIV